MADRFLRAGLGLGDPLGGLQNGTLERAGEVEGVEACTRPGAEVKLGSAASAMERHARVETERDGRAYGPVAHRGRAVHEGEDGPGALRRARFFAIVLHHQHLKLGSRFTRKHDELPRGSLFSTPVHSSPAMFDPKPRQPPSMATRRVEPMVIVRPNGAGNRSCIEYSSETILYSTPETESEVKLAARRSG